MEAGVVNLPLSFRDTCLFMFIALSPIDDFFLQGPPLRTFGASPALFPLVALGMLALLQWLAAGDFKVNRTLLVCLVYALAITVYGLFYFGFTIFGENLIWKGLKSFIALALLVFAATNIDYRPTPAVRAGIYAAFFLVLFSFCFGNANPFHLPSLLEGSIFHFTPNPDPWRPRGLASEPSMFSVSVIVFGLLCAHVALSRVVKVAVLIVTIAILVASGSRGGMLTLFLCLMILSIMRWHSRWYHVPGLLLVLLPLGFLFLSVIPSLFGDAGLSASGSLTTRLSMIVCALTIVRHHPLGVGLSGLLPAVGAHLPSAMYTVQSFFPIPLWFQEVSLHLTSGEMAGTMTFVFDQVIHFGIPFALFFFIFVVKLVKLLAVRKQVILVVAILASTLAMTIYAHTFGHYAVPILFGAALSEVRSGTNTSSSE